MAGSDVCEDEGLRLTPFTSATQKRIDELLPPLALRTNPVDMGPAWYDSAAIEGIVRAVMSDASVNGILFFIMFASANVGALEGLASLLMEWKQRKPLITCICAPQGIWDEEIRRLEEAGALVNYPTPERAAIAMAHLWRAKQLKRA
jgi:acyl-CoA synthetase (NDP forming)